MNEQSIEHKLESLIFAATEEIPFKKLSSLLNVSVANVKEGVEALNALCISQQRGIRLVWNDTTVQMVSAPENAGLVDALVQSDMREELTPSALETLAIIVYRQPIKKVDIDFMRGVNSSYALRSLLIRGLVERTHDANDARGFIYKPSLEFLKRLGISRIEELPRYQEIIQKLEEIKRQTVQETKGYDTVENAKNNE